MAQIALTGATGFIGRALIPHLVAEGHRLNVLARTPPHYPSQWPITVIPGDLSNTLALQSLVGPAEMVIHLAGATAAHSRADYFKANAAGTTQLLDAMVTTQTPAHLVHISSLAARMNQLSNYAASKWASESVVKASSIPWTILRPPAVYGGDDAAMKPLWISLKRGVLPCFGSSHARFSLLHVDDLTQALIQMLNRPSLDELAHMTLEIDDQFAGSGGPGYGWDDIAQIAEQAFHRPIRRLSPPKAALYLGAKISELWAALTGSVSVFNTDKLKELAHDQWVCEPLPKTTHFAWSPRRQLSDTLDELV